MAEIKYDITNKEQQERLKKAQSWYSEPIREIIVDYSSLNHRIRFVNIKTSYYDVRKLTNEQKLELNKAINLLNKKIAKCFKNSYDSVGTRKLFSNMKYNNILSRHEKDFKKFVKNLDVELVSAKTRDDKIERFVFNKEYTPEN